jgi:hypothetical protein
MTSAAPHAGKTEGSGPRPEDGGLCHLLAARDPRTPWYARGLIFFVVAHTFSPIDLIITPGRIWLAVRLISAEVLAKARSTAARREIDRRLGILGATLIILVWILAALGVIYLIVSRK